MGRCIAPSTFGLWVWGGPSVYSFQMLCIYVYIYIDIYIYRRSNHMPCRLDRLWLPKKYQTIAYFPPIRARKMIISSEMFGNFVGSHLSLRNIVSSTLAAPTHSKTKSTNGAPMGLQWVIVSPPKKVVGCRGGSRYVEADSLTWK